MRKGWGGGKSVREKHADDIWTLVNVIRNRQQVRRVLLRNGKRSRTTLVQSQERHREMSSRIPVQSQEHSPEENLSNLHCVVESQFCVNESNTPSEVAAALDAPCSGCTDLSFRSLVLKNRIMDINCKVHSLQSDMSSMPKPDFKTCLLYVRVFLPARTPIDQDFLEALLACPVLQFWCVRATPNPAFKVKISYNNLYKALKSSQNNTCFVALWRKPQHPQQTTHFQHPLQSLQETVVMDDLRNLSL